LAAGQTHGGHTLQPNDFYFADNPILSNLEDMAKREGLQFIEELVFENGAVYKGKETSNHLSVPHLSSILHRLLE